MLTKKTPETIKGDLNFKAQGVEKNLLLTYHNRTTDEYEAYTTNPENLVVPDTVTTQIDTFMHVNVSLVLFIVKSFDDGTEDAFPVTRDGLVDLERTWPGTLYRIISGYHKARAATIEKN